MEKSIIIIGSGTTPSMAAFTTLAEPVPTPDSTASGKSWEQYSAGLWSFMTY